MAHRRCATRLAIYFNEDYTKVKYVTWTLMVSIYLLYIYHLCISNSFMIILVGYALKRMINYKTLIRANSGIHSLHALIHSIFAKWENEADISESQLLTVVYLPTRKIWITTATSGSTSKKYSASVANFIWICRDADSERNQWVTQVLLAFNITNFMNLESFMNQKRLIILENDAEIS